MTGLDEIVLTGTALIKGQKLRGIMDSNFIMASMGSVVGKKITRLFEFATKENCQLFFFYRFRWCSDARRNREFDANGKKFLRLFNVIPKKIFYLTVLTDPTTGGVTASFAMEGDIIMAESQPLVGFAGRRVIESTVREKLQMISKSRISTRTWICRLDRGEEIRATVGQLLALHGGKHE